MDQYIFTPTGFYPDTQEKETLEKRYETLYHMGFSKRSKEMSSSELFLYELSETFFRCLTEMPEPISGMPVLLRLLNSPGVLPVSVHPVAAAHTAAGYGSPDLPSHPWNLKSLR